MIFNGQRNGLRRNGIIEKAIISDNLLHTRSEPRWQNLYRITNTDEAGFYAPHIPPKIVQFLGLGPADPLHGKPEIFEIDIVVDRNGLQQVHQRRALVPVEIIPALDHHIAMQGRHRDVGDIAQLESVGKSGKVLANIAQILPGNNPPDPSC